VTLIELTRFIAQGLFATISITILAMLLSAVIGFVVATLSISRFRLVRWISYTYIQVFRGVPVLVLLFIIYFGLTRLGLHLDSFTSAVLGLSIGGGAMVAETLRAGLAAVPRGQMEAAIALGTTRFNAVRLIILPQAAPLVFAPLSDFFVTLMKVTAVASAVAAPEITFQAKQVAQNTSQTTEAFLVLGALYLLIGLPMIWAIDSFEKKRNSRRRK
jgi:polar amino acid transport system permease protein/cystine transport system permease protein